MAPRTKGPGQAGSTAAASTSKAARLDLRRRYAAYVDAEPAPAPPPDEVDTYMKEPVTGDEDLLRWWKEKDEVTSK